jgi:predicted N-acetyltransferase YhbS
MKINIKLMTEENIPEAAKIYADVFNQTYPDENWTVGSAKDLLNYFYKTQPDLFLLATDEGKVIGCVAGIIKPWWNGLSFSDGELFVKLEYQNQKVGKQLLREVIKRAVDRYKISGIQGLTDGRTRFPLSWYKRVGLRESGYVHIEGEAQEILDNLK